MGVESVKYGDICDKCAHCGYCDMATFGGHNPPITACSHFSQSKQTNADRIRAMSDEELAEYLDGVCHDLWQMFVKDPQKMWLDWLKQEVKEDEHD